MSPITRRNDVLWRLSDHGKRRTDRCGNYSCRVVCGPLVIAGKSDTVGTLYDNPCSWYWNKGNRVVMEMNVLVILVHESENVFP